MMIAPPVLWVVGAVILSQSCIRAATPFGVLLQQLELAAFGAHCPHHSYGLTNAGVALFASLGAAISLVAMVAGSLGVYAGIWGFLCRTMVQVAAALRSWHIPGCQIMTPFLPRQLACEKAHQVPQLRTAYFPFLWRAPPETAPLMKLCDLRSAS